MPFERKSMEYLTNRMIEWVRGVSSRLTDFRVGSKNRALIEAVALVLEDLYDKVYRGLRQLIEDSIYAIFDFDKIPVTYATGIATFSRSTPADQSYPITAGTMLMSQATQYNSPIRFYTSVDSILPIGTMSVDVPVICDVPGIQGNIPAGYLITFVQKPSGVETVTNALEFISGVEEETKEDQKLRFQGFFEAQARGPLQSIEYGAKLAKLIDPITGSTVESVLQSVALEDLPSRKGEVDLYVWNGMGEASEALISAIQVILTGYYGSNGDPIYGYKSAGTQVNIYSAPTKPVVLKVVATAEDTTTLTLLKPLIEAEISRYFAALKLGQENTEDGQTVVQSALQSNIKRIDGVADIKLYLSIDDGVTFTMDNVLVDVTQIALVHYPVVYE